MELEVAEELQVGQNKEVLAPQATHSHSVSKYYICLSVSL